MIPGVDFSGKVIQSSNKKFKKGDKVILNGWGVGEKHFGGFSEYARVDANWLTHLPKNITEKDAMTIGSAGYTAALCVLELKKNKSQRRKIFGHWFFWWCRKHSCKFTIRIKLSCCGS